MIVVSNSNLTAPGYEANEERTHGRPMQLPDTYIAQQMAQQVTKAYARFAQAIAQTLFFQNCYLFLCISWYLIKYPFW